MDYHVRPKIAPETIAETINVLAEWLPSAADGAYLANWGRDEWLAAEWITYWQNALPWFVSRLRESGVSAPTDIQARLDKIDSDCRQRTALMLADAAKLLQLLRTESIPVVPLKGTVLAPLYFDDPLIRPFGDLDFFVQHKDATRVATILQDNGYRFHKRTAKDEVFLIGERDHENVWSPRNVRPIEVQTQTLNEYGGLVYDMAPLMWESLEERAYWNSIDCAVPNKIALLHHVCAHATEDWLMRRGKLMQIYDVQQLVGHFSAEDWQTLITTIPPHGARFVYPTLAFLHQHTPVTIPDFVLKALAPHVPTQLQQWIAEVMFGELFEQRSGTGEWHELRVGKLLARSIWDQGRIFGRLLFPPRYHFRLKNYPRLVQSRLWPLAYIQLNFDRARQLIAG